MAPLLTCLTSARGQTSPLPALIALVAVCSGVTLYVGAHATVNLDSPDQSPADSAVDQLAEALTADGPAETDALNDSDTLAAIDPVPDGYNYRTTIEIDDQRIHAGPEPPSDADRATRRVPVESTPGTVRPGRLTVEVWS